MRRAQQSVALEGRITLGQTDVLVNLKFIGPYIIYTHYTLENPRTTGHRSNQYLQKHVY